MIILSALLSVVDQTVPAQDVLHESASEHNARMAWWRDARFGLFIHWGIYSVPAGEWNGKTNYGEWIRHSAQIPLKTYEQFVGQFNPVKFDARTWVRMAKAAGMQYIVITSKHHDGFCMFDSKQTDFDIMSTPFHRDVLKELSAACRAEGIKLCFYYSIMDWHHPDYLPRRPWEEKSRPVDGADFDRYVRYMKAELKELLTNYGPIGVLWFDGEWESTWNERRGLDLYKYVRSLQPSIIINNRVGAGRAGMAGITKEGEFGGDYGTPEQEVPATGLPGVDWETCMTMNDNWGYNKNDQDWKSGPELIQTLADIASKGGNFLLNVGPTSQGVFPDTSIERLQEIGRWMKLNGEAIHGTSASPFKHLDWGRCTQRETKTGSRLYLHVFDWPKEGLLVVPGLLSRPTKAFMLADGKKNQLEVTRREDAVVIRLNDHFRDPSNTVVVLDVEGRAAVANPPVIQSDPVIFIDSLDVGVTSDVSGQQIRYTLDGSTPTSNSPLLNETVRVFNSCAVSARLFANNKPVSPVSRQSFRKVIPLAAESPSATVPGIRYAYYEGAWDTLPHFSTLKPFKEGTLTGISFAPRVHEDQFGFVYQGYANIPADDVYTFFLSSDDGSRLWVGDSLVVDNDGLHSMLEKQGTIALSAGWHSIRIEYFERSGGDGLSLSLKSRSMPKQIIPNSFLFH